MKTLKKILLFIFLFILTQGYAQNVRLGLNREQTPFSSETSIIRSKDDSLSLLVPLCNPSAVNDNCATAAVLIPGAKATSGTLCNSTLQAGEPNSICGTTIGNSVWYSFQATATEMYVDVNQLSGMCYLAVAVYGGYATSASGCTPSSSQQIICFGATSPIEKTLRMSNLTINGWYMVQVGYISGGPCGTNGNATFDISVNTPQYCTTCSTSCGTVKGYNTAPASYQQLQNDGACFPMRFPNDTIQKHFTFIADDITISVNAGWYATGGCAGFSSVSFSLYDNCTLIATNSTGSFSGLTLNTAYTIYYNLILSSSCNNDTLCPYYVRTTPLPVSLLYFRAEEEDEKIICRWATASESGSDLFFVERSTDASDWQAVASVKAAGNSSTEKKYSAADDDAPAGKLFYRLKQTDQNGDVNYSPVASVEHRAKDDNILSFNSENNLLSVYLPFYGRNALLFVYDVFGRTIYSSALIPGTIYTVDFSAHNKGLYVASLWYDSKNKISKKFFVQQ